MSSITEQRVARLIAYVKMNGEVTLWKWVHLTQLGVSTVQQLFTLAAQAHPDIVRRRGKLVWVGEKSEFLYD